MNIFAVDDRMIVFDVLKKISKDMLWGKIHKALTDLANLC